MHFIKSKYLFVPVLFLLILFLLDKLFLLPEVRNHFIQPGGMVYYKQRELQIQSLQQVLKNKNVKNNTVVIFGDSRSLSLGELTLLGSKSMHKKYSGLNVFNFSSPQALPAYYAYLAEKIFSGMNRPKYLIVGLSPDSFNRNAGTMLKPVMIHGLSDRFIKKYNTVISQKDKKGYENSKRFALSGLGFSLRALRDRLSGGFGKKDDQALLAKMVNLRKFYQTGEQTDVNPIHLMLFYKELGTALQPNMKHYNIHSSPWRFALDMTRGAYYGWVETASDAALEKETRKLEKTYFKNFIVSQEQLFFVRQLLSQAKLSGAKIIVYWPRVNPYLRRLYKDYPQIPMTWSRIAQITQEAGGISINMNEKNKMKCDSFYDASHISALCAIELQEKLLDRLIE